MPSSACASAPAILPISVSIPVPVTTTTPRPYTTVLPIYTIFFLSPKGTSLAFSVDIASEILLTGTDSPVSAASSTFKLALSKIRASAGTESPASNSTISPTTRFSLGVITTLPSRSTLEVAADISCSASIAFSALLSWNTPSTALRITTARMMMTSEGNSPSIAAITPLIAAATIKMIIIGSVSCSKNRRTSDFFFAATSLFLPCSASRFSASAVVKPCVASDCRSASTCSFS